MMSRSRHIGCIYLGHLMIFGLHCLWHPGIELPICTGEAFESTIGAGGGPVLIANQSFKSSSTKILPGSAWLTSCGQVSWELQACIFVAWAEWSLWFGFCFCYRKLELHKLQFSRGPRALFGMDFWKSQFRYMWRGSGVPHWLYCVSFVRVIRR